MEKHPTKKELELFLGDRLPGEAAVKVLLHMDECEVCRNSLPDKNTHEVIESLLAEEDERHYRRTTYE